MSSSPCELFMQIFAVGAALVATLFLFAVMVLVACAVDDWYRDRRKRQGKEVT